MHRSTLALAGAALAAAQGFSTECTDITLTNDWLVATCPTGSDSEITSSVYLSGKLADNDGTLEWAEDGNYAQSCQDCSLVDGATLQCECRIAAYSSYRDTSINLEEHIANYEGHLLSNQTGSVTIPEDSSTPVPSNFAAKLELSDTSDSCETTGITITLDGPSDCYYINLGVELSYTSGITTDNEGWEIVAYSDKECTTAVKTFTEANDDQCVAFEPNAKAFSVKPLWNADY
ncbi:Cyanovirin-N [Aspergillus unguis]